MTGRPVSVALIAFVLVSKLHVLLDQLRTHLSKDVRHQSQLGLDHPGCSLDCILAVLPGNTVRARTVQPRLIDDEHGVRVFCRATSSETYVRGPETKGHPSTVDSFGGCTFKASDVMRPESEPRTC